MEQLFDLTSKVEQDSLGYLWISDLDGLYKYDGYAFSAISFRKIFGETAKSRSSAFFKKDTRGNFWIGTERGQLAQIDYQGRVINYDKLLSGETVSAMESYADLVWFGTNRGSLFRYNLKSGKIDRKIVIQKNDNTSVSILDIRRVKNDDIFVSASNSQVYQIESDRNLVIPLRLPVDPRSADRLFLTSDNMNRLWIVSEFNGVLAYNPVNKSVKQVAQKDKFTGRYIMYRTVFCDDQGLIWLGTDGSGLQCLDPKTANVTTYQHQFGNPFSIPNNTVRHINQDRDGNIWVIVKGGVLSVLPRNRYAIANYTGLPQNIPFRVLSMLESRDGNIWIGTDGAGLSRISSTGQRRHFHQQGGGSDYFPGAFVQAMAEDQTGNIWFGTYQSGLFKFDEKSKSIQKIDLDALLKKTHVQDVRTVFIDSKNRVWISTTFGIHILHSNGTLMTSIPYGSRGLVGSMSECIYEDGSGVIWIAMNRGRLFRLDSEIFNFSLSSLEPVSYHPQTRDDPGRYSISQIVETKGRDLWLRCEAGFLIKYEKKTDKFISLEGDARLASIDILSCLLDEHEILWLGSRNGLHKYDPAKNIVTSFYENDGLQGDQFIKRSAFKTNEGRLFFGGDNGFSSFYPRNMNKIYEAAHLYINQINVLNKPIENIADKNTDRKIERIEEIKLDANESSFAFGFSAIGDLLHANFTYKYRLRGFEESWTTASSGRNAIYTNLPAGDYIFEVVAARPNSGDFDIGPATVKINISKYWWETTSAYMFYLIVICGIAFIIWKWYLSRRKLVLEKNIYQKEKAIYSAKINFFAKISHEIQTPLSLILGPVQNILARNNQFTETDRTQLNLVKNNAERLSHVVREMTLVRDKEIERPFRPEMSDLFSHLRTITLSFSELAKNKDILFSSLVPAETLVLHYDRIQIEHVIYNLLNNAMKFTPSGGKVTLCAKRLPHAEEVVIVVQDDGIGIKEDDQEKVFQLFYQSDDGREMGGLGIGLALCKEIVIQHNGRIKVDSNHAEGSRFEVVLPVQESTILPLPYSDDGKTECKNKISEEPLIPRTETKESVLIIEDNHDMRLFVSDLLRERYEVHNVEHAEAALDLLERITPQLIISDVMMPGITGIDFTAKIQSIERINYIPILLMTAYPSMEDRLKSFEAGAVHYMRKPFHPVELTALVDNIVQRQRLARSHYFKSMQTMPVSSDGQPSKSDMFLRDLTQILKDRMNDSDFHLEHLASLLNMSYSVVFRRCQELTGKTPIEYFKIIRLKQAALLLVRFEYSISEAAYEVGYSDTKYFSKIFKEIFRMSPSQFRTKVNKVELDDVLSKF